MIDWKQEWKKLLAIVAVFLIFFWLPVGWDRFAWGISESLQLARWYAREHVLLCLVPAFFIAGAIGVFISQASVMKYLGAGANKVLAYGVASVSGSILAVCSCTVLPLFAGIWRMGAGLGPATAFLYSGPAINVLAIILTARVLGMELGIARAVGAISFSVIIGLIMHFIYRKEELAKANAQLAMPVPQVARPLWQNAAFFFVMVGVLVFANWSKPAEVTVTVTDKDHSSITYGGVIERQDDDFIHLRGYIQASSDGQEPTLLTIPRPGAIVQPAGGLWWLLYQAKWLITGILAAALGLILIFWMAVKWWKVVLAGIPPAVLAMALPMDGLGVMIPFAAAVVGLSVILSTDKGEGGDWLAATWGFTVQILPLLLLGVLVAGFLLGRPGHEGFIPNKYIQMLVGDSPNRMLEMTGWGGGTFENLAGAAWPIWTNFFASVFGAFMYFATLTEVPILQGLIGAGMGKGPALALLLAGPALSLPNMLVIAGIMGARKTAVFVSLVVVMATISGMIFGAFF